MVTLEIAMTFSFKARHLRKRVTLTQNIELHIGGIEMAMLGMLIILTTELVTIGLGPSHIATGDHSMTTVTGTLA